VALIDCRHPEMVIEGLVCRLRWNAQSCHTGNHCSAEIVSSPAADPGEPVGGTLPFAKA
jgi:hypothetical protein